MTPDHPIVALATPFLKSPIAVIRVTGNNSIPLLARICKDNKKLLNLYEHSPNTLHNIALIHPDTHDPLDDAMVAVYKSPHSYTGQESAELFIHGSIAGITQILDTLHAVGFAYAEPGEFTKRRFLNGKINLTQAEAIHNVIEAQTATQHTQALQQLAGSVSDYINRIKKSLVRLVAICSVSLDYPEDEIQESTEIDINMVEDVLQKLQHLIRSYDLTRIQNDGVTVVLGGLTNAGKSSLFNALLKEDRAIVNEEHGTTRDFLECNILLKDIPCRIFDTAGLRESENTVEQEGIARSHTLFKSANIILYVADLTKGWTSQDTKQILQMYSTIEETTDTITSAQNNRVHKKILIVWNKIDMLHTKQQIVNIHNTLPQLPPHVLSLINHHVLDIHIGISAIQRTHMDELQHTLYSIITQGLPVHDHTQVAIHSTRQKKLLETCYESMLQVQSGIHNNIPLDMISLDVDLATRALGEITGEVTSAEILDEIFSNFCLGK